MIELMLAMGFVSMLLVSIAVMVIHIADMYTRGLALKEINQAGRAIVTDLKRSVATSTPYFIDPATGYEYTKGETNISYYIEQKGSDGKIGGGRLCLPRYSYIWNFGKNISIDKPVNEYSGSDHKKVIYFIKIYDQKADYCKMEAPNKYKDVKLADAVELISKNQSNLAIQNFSITTKPSATDSLTGEQMYDIEFVLGTNDKLSLKYDPTETKCKLPNDVGSDPLYCSINKFHVAVRGGNKFN